LKNQEDEKNADAFFESPDSKNLAGSSHVSGLKTLNTPQWGRGRRRCLCITHTRKFPCLELVIDAAAGTAAGCGEVITSTRPSGITWFIRTMKSRRTIRFFESEAAVHHNRGYGGISPHLPNDDIN
jgi:hypothetical protein